MSAEGKCVITREYYSGGNPEYEEFLNSDGKWHNEAGPARRRWYANGQIGHEAYYLNGKQHNEHGPAYLYWYANGQIATELYYLNGERHNAAGPAVRWWHEDGKLRREVYWLNNKQLQKAEWEAAVKPAA
jgi:hypothetical protein